MALTPLVSFATDDNQNTDNMEELVLTTEWDKTFPQSDKVEYSKVTFRNRYGVTLAADLYKPKDATGSSMKSLCKAKNLPAIAVSGPYGAIKEQVSGRYAQTLAERGFLTIAFDPSFYGESGGHPRNLTSPEISTEDFSAAVDYLLNRDDVILKKSESSEFAAGAGSPLTLRLRTHASKPQ